MISTSTEAIDCETSKTTNNYLWPSRTPITRSWINEQPRYRRLSEEEILQMRNFMKTNVRPGQHSIPCENNILYTLPGLQATDANQQTTSNLVKSFNRLLKRLVSIEDVINNHQIIITNPGNTMNAVNTLAWMRFRNVPCWNNNRWNA